ncbi:hypothetical protein ALP61_02391 [Pseudomonas savastanoi]|nr:hypothetical protein ALP61_02391 [Pseudomonas savastanoi]
MALAIITAKVFRQESGEVVGQKQRIQRQRERYVYQLGPG